jgi:hypothetical protein
MEADTSYSLQTEIIIHLSYSVHCLAWHVIHISYNFASFYVRNCSELLQVRQ